MFLKEMFLGRVDKVRRALGLPVLVEFTFRAGSQEELRRDPQLAVRRFERFCQEVGTRLEARGWPQSKVRHCLIGYHLQFQRQYPTLVATGFDTTTTKDTS